MTLIGKYKHPNLVIASTLYYQPLVELGSIHPIYPLKDKTPLRSIKSMIAKALSVCQNYNHDPLPIDVIQSYQLMNQAEAMKNIHQPESLQELMKAILRFKVSEFLEYHIQIQNNRLRVVHSKQQRHLSSDSITHIS